MFVADIDAGGADAVFDPKANTMDKSKVDPSTLGTAVYFCGEPPNNGDFVQDSEITYDYEDVAGDKTAEIHF